MIISIGIKYSNLQFELIIIEMAGLVRSVFLLTLFTVVVIANNLAASEELQLEDVCEEMNSGNLLVCSNFNFSDDIAILQSNRKNITANYIKITNSELVTIPHNLFLHVKNASHFTALANNIDYLDANSFRDGGKLIKIALNNNNLESIRNDTFATNTILALLEIYDNRLEEISEGAFRNLNYLQEFEIFAPNVNLMNVKYFQDLIELQYLTLKLNTTTLFDGRVFQNNQNLIELGLSGNGIESIINGSLGMLTKLRTLDLSYNKLGPKFNISTTGQINTLEFLSLSGNKLEELNYEIIPDLFPNLASLDISLNDFQCNYLSALLSNFNGTGINIISDNDNCNLYEQFINLAG